MALALLASRGEFVLRQGAAGGCTVSIMVVMCVSRSSKTAISRKRSGSKADKKLALKKRKHVINE